MVKVGSKVKVNDRLRRMYYNPEHPASFSSLNRLVKASKLPPNVVKEWLLKQEVYTTHLPARKSSKKIPFYSPHYINQTWEIDLNDMSSYARFNKGYRHILTVIDIFSRQAAARALKSKKQEVVVEAMKDIFETSGVKPKLIQSDLGGEFVGAKFRTFLKEHGVAYRNVRNQVKGSIIERFNRSIKQRIIRALDHKNSFDWVSILPQVLTAYNKASHRSLNGRAPNDITSQNAYNVWKENYLKHMSTRQPFSKPKFYKGDYVRISKHKKVFDKGYTQSYSTEVYLLHTSFVFRGVCVYLLSSLTQKEILDGYFYEHELTRVFYIPEAFYKIESVLDHRVRPDGQSESFVTFQGWNKSHASWIPTSWIQNINKHGRESRIPSKSSK